MKEQEEKRGEDKPTRAVPINPKSMEKLKDLKLERMTTLANTITDGKASQAYPWWLAAEPGGSSAEGNDSRGLKAGGPKKVDAVPDPGS